ncbi:MAG: hypothetical protein HYU66_28505, partial [Armatimonadetes bacterium]|nr:hypothetical protein [Armatimonadota bacterium]
MRPAALVLATLLPLTLARADDALRRSSVFVEGEDFAPDGPGWSPGQGWNDDIYTATSGDAVLGNNGDQGEAKREVTVPAAGTYQVWALYLKIGEYPGTFGLRIEQGGKAVFDQRYRTKPEGGDWRPVWEQFPAELQAGPATLTVYLAQPGIRQRLDCVLITPKADYKPDYHDFAPQVFCRYRVIAPAGAVVPSVDTYLHRAPVYYYAPGAWTAKGFDGTGEPVPAGSWSPWVDLSRYMDSGKWLTTVKLRFLSGGKPVERVKVELQVAPEADEAQARSFPEDLEGELVTLVLPGDLRKFPAVATTASRLSARHLADVRALGLSAPPPPGRIPLELWVCGWGGAYHAPRILADELGAARQLGATSLNDLHGPARTIATRLGVRQQYLSQWLPYQAWTCPTTDKQPQIMDEHFAKVAADIRKDDPQGLNGLYRNILWDEPGTSDLKHLRECPSCLAAFRAFLKAQALEPAALGAADWEAVKPLAREQAVDGPSRRLHVQSIAFRDRTNAMLVRAARLAAEKHLGADVLQSVNFTDGALSGWEAGMVHGPDWFLYGRTQATSLLWSEDWACLGPEVSGYIVDMLRAAARPNRLAVGEYIICNHVPTLEQRAFSALAHGAKILHFYCYGPYYAFADGMVSDSPETQKALARTLRGIASADEALAAAAQPRA